MKTINEPSTAHLAVGFIAGVGVAATSTILNDGTGYFNSLWPGLVGLLIMIWFFVDLQAVKHEEKISAGMRINHFGAGVLRVVVGLAMCCIIHAYYFRIDKIIELLVAGLFWFAFFFTVTLNLLRGLALNYVSVDKRSSLADRFFSLFGKHGGTVQLWVYAIGFYVAGYVYIKL